jgi:2-polyprenyl-3-methyl-5-hydroxy-6-metoxy-1,4-benzoquinol methylase
MFDIVFTNHVVEHIEDQRSHLQEIHRVLKPGAVCYLATPNRNYPIEPHYKIPLIHYLPHGLFHGVLRLLGRYKEDLFLLSHQQMLKLFSSHGFKVTEYTGRVLKDPERFHLGFTPTRYIPAFLVGFIERISPTNIFILRKIA